MFIKKFVIALLVTSSVNCWALATEISLGYASTRQPYPSNLQPELASIAKPSEDHISKHEIAQTPNNSLVKLKTAASILAFAGALAALPYLTYWGSAIGSNIADELRALYLIRYFPERIDPVHGLLLEFGDGNYTFLGCLLGIVPAILLGSKLIEKTWENLPSLPKVPEKLYINNLLRHPG